VKAVPTAGVVVVVLLVLTGPAAAHAEPLRPAVDPSLALISSLDVREELVALDPGESGASGGGQSPPAAFLYSLAVPGAGQLVQGEKRGFIYLAAEAAFWTGFFVLNGEGLDKRDAYEDFADEYWDYDAYVEHFDENCQEDPHDPANGCRPLAPYGSQEFYEDIGKYEVYWPYWRPASEWQAVRDQYWQMRKDSNRDLRNARYFVTAAFLNHLVSAVDSFLSARSGRADDHAGRDLSLEFAAADAGEGLSCAVVMRY
jgi:hypothetical protein